MECDSVLEWKVFFVEFNLGTCVDKTESEGVLTLVVHKSRYFTQSCTQSFIGLSLVIHESFELIAPSTESLLGRNDQQVWCWHGIGSLNSRTISLCRSWFWRVLVRFLSFLSTNSTISEEPFPQCWYTIRKLEMTAGIQDDVWNYETHYTLWKTVSVKSKRWRLESTQQDITRTVNLEGFWCQF